MHGKGTGRGTHIAKLPPRPDQLAQVGGQVVAAVVLLDARRPVVLARADEHVLRVAGDGAVERGGVVDLEAVGELGGWGAGTCRRRAGWGCWEGWGFGGCREGAVGDNKG